MRKIKGLLITLVFLFGCLFTVSALAAGKTGEGTFNGFTWVFDESKLSISGSGTLEVQGPWDEFRKSVKVLEFSGEDLYIDASTNFNAYSKVNTIHFGKGAIGAESYCFQTISKSVTFIIDDPAFVWRPGMIQPIRIKNIELSEEATQYMVKDGFLLSGDGKEAVVYFGNQKKGAVVVPDSVETIKQSAFATCSATEIILPAGLKRIEDHAFSYCAALKQLTVPASVETIGASAFEGCKKLTALNFLNLKMETDYHFSPDYYFDMNAIKVLVLPAYQSVGEVDIAYAKALETMVISEGTENIQGYNGVIGEQCKKLKRVFFPSSLKEIEAKNVGLLLKTEWCVIENSYAHQYAKENGYTYTIVKPITAVNISEQALQLNVGKGAALKATIEPTDATSQGVQWMSTNELVATVDEKGKVKAVGAGECDILCRGVDCGAVTAVCHVKVIIPIQSLNVKEKIIAVMASETIVPEIIFKPENATNQEVAFSSSDESVVRVAEDGSLRAISGGKADITVVSTDGSNKKVTFKVEVSRKNGKYDGVVNFRNLKWGMNYETCVQMLREEGLMDSHDGSFERQRNGVFQIWPDDDIKLTNRRMYTDLPLGLERVAGGYACFAPIQDIAGYPARIISLGFLNHINDDGSVEPDTTELISVCITMYATDYNKKITDIFKDVLTKLEAEYGSFKIYTPEELKKWEIKGMKVYDDLADLYNNANYYSTKESFADNYNGEHPNTGVLCVIHGTDDTGIMIWLDASMVTILYGKTDASERIRKIEQGLNKQ